MQHLAKSAQSKSDLREYAGNFRVWSEARFELQAVANFTGICCLRSTPASSCCSATSCTFLRPFSPPFVVQTGGVVLEECPSTLSTQPTSGVQANSLPAAMICCALQGWLGVHRTRPDRRRARGACAGGFGGPKATIAVRPSNSMVGKGLLAGGAALRPAHCPKFLPVTSRKCFVMLSTAYNRCGVFAGIGTMLTGRHKTAIVLQPAVRGR